MISSELKASVKETLEIMTKVNFGSLSHDKSIEWNLALSKTCLRFSQEMSLLKRELSEVRRSNHEDAEFRDRSEFAKVLYPAIKKHSHQVFSKLIFPSHLEVTTTAPNSLVTYGLTSTCDLAKCIFEDIVFQRLGSGNLDCISVDNDVTSHHHPYDTPQVREDLWHNHGIGSLSVQEVGRVRNTVTNICRDTTSE